MVLRSSKTTRIARPCEPGVRSEFPQPFRWLRFAFSCRRPGDSRDTAEPTRQDPSFVLSNQPNQTEPYDNAGRRASLTVPGQSVVNDTFDNTNRLTQIAQGTTTVGFTYDNANRRATLILPNGVVTSYSYDTASQLTGMTYTLGNNPLGNLSYAYDNDGRRSSGTGTFARTGLPLAMNQTAYNANNQLTTWGTANLFYDLNGNMTSDGTHSYTWDARNH